MPGPAGTAGPFAGLQSVEVNGRRYFIRDGRIYKVEGGRLVETHEVSFGELGVTPPDPTTTDDSAITTEERQAASEQQLASLGLPTSTNALSVRDFFAQAGVDTDAPEVQLAIDTFQQRVEDPNDTIAQSLLPMLAQSMAEKFPSVPQTQYSQALALSGFTDPFPAPEPAPSAGPALRQKPGLDVQDLRGTQQVVQPNFETQPDTGWVRFRNDVLVDMTSGTVFYKPGSTAPGSPWWQQQVVSKWGAGKISEWRSRLHDMGYLSSDQAKVKAVDQTFLSALAAYHQARYLNGGKAVPGDLAAMGPGAASEPKPVDLHDFSAQIRNDVREQYKRIYGVDASDGEVQAWTDYVMRTGMQLQRKFIRKYDSPMTDTAATEAEERLVERLEQSPEGRFLAEADEENTRLRDTMERMAVVSQSLAS